MSGVWAARFRVTRLERRRGFGAPSLRFSQLLRRLQLTLALGFPLGCLALGSLPGGVQEGFLLGVQLSWVGLSPFCRLRQTRATVKRPRIALQELPLLGGFRQMAVDAQPFAILRQPLAQRGPLADQGFVRHFCHALSRGDQARIRQLDQHFFHLLRIAIRGGRHKLADRHPAARVLRALSQFRQPQEDVAGNLLLLGGQLAIVDALGRPGDGPAHPARFRVGSQAHQVAPPPPPRLQQGMREQGQGAWLWLAACTRPNVVQHQVHQPGGKLPAAALGWRFDRLAQLICPHRPQVFLVLGHFAAQPGVLRQVLVEIRPQGHHHPQRTLISPGGI